jgi:exonuclease III
MKQTGVAIFISNKTDIQRKVIKQDVEGHLIFIKGKLHQEKVSILNNYVPNAREPTFIKENLLKLKAHIEPHTILVGDFSTPFSQIDKLLKQKLSRDTLKLVEVMK